MELPNIWETDMIGKIVQNGVSGVRARSSVFRDCDDESSSSWKKFCHSVFEHFFSIPTIFFHLGTQSGVGDHDPEPEILPRVDSVGALFRPAAGRIGP